MKQLNYNKVLWTAGLFILAIVVIAAVKRKSGAEIVEIVADIQPMSNGFNLIRQAEVEEILHKGFGFTLRGVHFDELDINRIERVLEADPFIKETEAYVDGGNNLQLEIVQREPVIRIIDAQNANYYLDSEGIRMPLSKHFTARVLVATGNIPPYSPDFLKRKKYLLKDIFDLGTKIAANDFLNPLVEQVYVNKEGEMILVPKVGNQKILIGNIENIEDKLYRLEQFYKKALPFEGWDKYSLINLKFKNQIICKKR
jgi:cell division protein FtsQ